MAEQEAGRLPTIGLPLHRQFNTVLSDVVGSATTARLAAEVTEHCRQESYSCPLHHPEGVSLIV